MAMIHQKDLISGLGNAFGSSKYSDLTIHCGSDVYKLHRVVICPRSDFFAAACDSGFKESVTATISLDDDDQSTVHRMLTYLYTLDYDDEDAFSAVVEATSHNTDGFVLDSASKPNAADNGMASRGKCINNIRVYTLAEKYNIRALKELAKAKFEKCIAERGIYQFADFIDAVLVSSPETDSGLRDILISRVTDPGALESILREGALSSAIRDDSSFGLGVLREVIRKLFSEWEKQKQKQSMWDLWEAREQPAESETGWV